jgi:ankyrin repeat protein
MVTNHVKPQAQNSGTKQRTHHSLMHLVRIAIMYLFCGTGQTRLHIAASNGHANVVKWLLGRGASPNVLDRNGFTPLASAAGSVADTDVINNPTMADAG